MRFSMLSGSWIQKLFSLWEWNDAVAYITREPVSFRGKEQAARYLLNYKENREEIMAEVKA